jgi:hypothetical protein
MIQSLGLQHNIYDFFFWLLRIFAKHDLINVGSSTTQSTPAIGDTKEISPNQQVSAPSIVNITTTTTIVTNHHWQCRHRLAKIESIDAIYCQAIDL